MAPADQFAALADPTRCRVIEMLRERPHPVHELAAAFEISRPAISRHLRVLKDVNLVSEERQGRENVYTLRRQQLRPLADWLSRQWNVRSIASNSQAAGTAPQMELDF